MPWFLVHLCTLRVFQNMKTRRTLMEETAPGWMKLLWMAQSLDCRRCWRWRIAQVASRLLTCQLTFWSIVLWYFISFVWRCWLLKSYLHFISSATPCWLLNICLVRLLSNCTGGKAQLAKGMSTTDLSTFVYIVNTQMKPTSKLKTDCCYPGENKLDGVRYLKLELTPIWLSWSA